MYLTLLGLLYRDIHLSLVFVKGIEHGTHHDLRHHLQVVMLFVP